MRATRHVRRDQDRTGVISGRKHGSFKRTVPDEMADTVSGTIGVPEIWAAWSVSESLWFENPTIGPNHSKRALHVFARCFCQALPEGNSYSSSDSGLIEML